ncbi:MAG TPA: CoA transferase [Phenylobacterium sp.]|uniref:CaiB/BaiF CoA transferase family protein n=1 Tax=Phenylobacterium sp. TaxID=1871053 RepID=UPI002CB1C15D|nr:CoA transferase [Phenylobacterium sp.]HSV04828.1 CoA transferase [Phenylobacterium sp.]
MLLRGVKVVEFASYIAAPAAACMLGDWGADVIKVERSGGDAMRAAFADVKSELKGNPTFDLDNRGKRAIVLDISKPEGRDALARLAADADVFITNVRPAALKRAGLDYDSLRQANPRLVYSIVTGYGLDGPDAHKPGFDVTAFWARSGVGAMTVPKGMDPFMIRSGFGDHITALATVAAIMAGLFERERTGHGRLVATSLLGSGVYTMGSDLAVQLKFGRVASMRTRDQSINPIGNVFKSAEGRWFLVNPRGGGSSRDWIELCRILGREDLVEDERFKTGKARRANSPALIAELDRAFAELPFEEIARRFDEADMVWSPLQTPADVAADPQVAATALVQVEDGEGGAYPSPATPMRFPGADVAVRPRSPTLGEHTRQVLAELGYSAEAIEAMYAAGAAA